MAGNHLRREDVLVATVAICVGRHFLYNGLATSSVLTFLVVVKPVKLQCLIWNINEFTRFTF